MRMHRGRVWLRFPILLVLALAVFPVGCNEDPVAWDLVWSDEFDGTAVDQSRWTFEIGDGCPSLCGWGNNELEYYQAENATVADGFLTITAREQAIGTRAYTSARMVTRDKAEFTYGKFEARIKLPVGQGIWPAFWMLGADVDAVGWPDCGEIDIMEYLGNDPRTLYGTVHGPGYSGGESVGSNTRLSGAGFNADFHVFGIEWERDRITWFLDGKSFQTVTPAVLPPDHGGSSITPSS